MDFSIEHYGWNQVGPFPEVSGSIHLNALNFNVQFDVRESDFRAVHSVHNAMVYEDSCVEMFFQPYTFDERYINIEINPIGTVLAAIGEERNGRTFFTEKQIHALDVKTAISRGANEVHWSVQYAVPYALIAELFGIDHNAEPDSLRCNLYKCGDLLSNPHWGSWKPIHTEQPDFHRPEFFARCI